MKKLRITVENRAYDVTVQVLEDDEALTTRTSLPPPKLSSRPPSFAPPPAANANVAPLISKSPKLPAPAPSNGVDLEAILAPVAGTVVKLFVQPGAVIEAKAPVVMLDAMKMDTYIYAPRDGEVAAVEVNVGDSVQVGECLIRYAKKG